ncbi:MAG TPA: hypothetical protein DCR25_03915 [Rhodobacter sp.]|nr:hypothetical protein [Rhodobacter sp.]
MRSAKGWKIAGDCALHHRNAGTQILAYMGQGRQLHINRKRCDSRQNSQYQSRTKNILRHNFAKKQGEVQSVNTDR